MKKWTKQAGMASGTVMIVMVGLSIVGVTMLTAVSSEDRFADRSAEQLTAQTLAESGIEKLYSKIRDDMRDTGQFPTTLPQETMVANGETLGVYDARVIESTSETEDFTDGSYPFRRTLYTFTLEGTGRSERNVLSAKVQATFTAVLEYNLDREETQTQTGSSAGNIWYPAAAMASAEGIDIVTDGGLRTYAGDGKSAHLVANAGMTWKPYGNKNKSTVVNPNVLDIQGAFVVHKDALSSTKGSNGLGNNNGTKNFRSPIDATLGLLTTPKSDEVVGVDVPVSFADENEVNGWQSNWDATSNKPNAEKHNGNVKATQIVPHPTKGYKVLPAPARINGNLLVEAGETLRLMPTSDNPAENVVYVTGDVSNLGQIMNLGVKVVVVGKYSDSPTAEYKLDLQDSKYATRPELLRNSGLISLSKRKDAIEITSNSTATTGLMYAAKGGININSSNAELRGILIAGGRGAFGGINVQPGGGNSFVVHYEPDAAQWGSYSDVTTETQVTYSLGSLRTPFAPEKIRNWSLMNTTKYRRNASGQVEVVSTSNN